VLKTAIVTLSLLSSTVNAIDWVYFPDGTEIKKEQWMINNEKKAQYLVNTAKETAEKGMCDFFVNQDKKGNVLSIETVQCFPEATPAFGKIMSKAIYDAAPFTPPTPFKGSFVITLRANN
jgi:hypothetical protein